MTEGPDGRLRLSCDEAALHQFPHVEQINYERMDESPVAEPGWAIGIEDVLSYPYHYEVELDADWYDDGYTVAWDRIPAGEVEIRRSSLVRTTDGHEIGRVDGLICDDDDQVTHLILARGHLWAAREVIIPIGAAVSVGNDLVELSLTKDEVANLPGARIGRPWWRPPQA